jgi:hypothetical protein
MPPTSPEPSGLGLEALRARIVELEQEVARRQREASDTRGRLAESETLLGVAGVLSRPLPIEEAMRRVAREVSRSFAADMVGVYSVDTARKALVPMAGYHVPKHLLSAFVETPFPGPRTSSLTRASTSRS